MISELEEFEQPWDVDKFISLHKCRSCWGILQKTMYRKEDGIRYYKAVCECCGEKTKGYISRKYVLRRIQENVYESIEAKRALKDAVPWIKLDIKVQSEDEIMKSLGF
jgi:hypothetical protein